MQVKTQLEDLDNYLTDASNMQGGHATRLFVPTSAVEVADILREANEQGIAVTISGARTGTVGGAIPFGGYVVSLERLNRIVEVDRERKVAVVQPGVILGDLQRAVEAEGLFYPPDPTEWSCQIGGTVATNASGARSFKYGATREFVERLNVVLASGEEIVIRRGEFIADETGSVSVGPLEFKTPTYERPNVRKNVSGYFNAEPLDAIDLFIGSEGTLAVISEIELRLIEKPKEFFSGIVFFPTERDLLAFVEEAKVRSFAARKNPVAIAPGSDMIDASLLEYFDDRALKFISERFPETPAAAGAIFFEQEMSGENEDALLTAWNDLLEKHNADIDRSWFATSDQDREKMRAFRHSLPVSVNERVVRNKQKKIGTDMAVPDENFPAFLRYYKETLDASGLEYNPITRRYWLSDNTSVNYMFACRKPA